MVQAFLSTALLVRPAGAIMSEQDEIWQESRYFSEARKMIESVLELADRIEAE